MLQRTLGSGWGVLLPGVIIVGLAFIGGMMLAMMNWNQG